MNTRILFLSRIEIDILLVNLLSILLISIIALSLVTVSLNIIRGILAFLYVAFFPGYILSKILFFKGEVNTVERAALSVGLSMIIIPVIGLILAYSPWKTTLYPSIFLIYVFILTASIVRQFLLGFSTTGLKRINLGSKQINVLLLAILITLLGIFVRFYPALEYSSFGGNWMPGNCLYPIYYTLQTGEPLERGGIETSTLLSSTIYNAIHNKANLAFQTFNLLIAGFTDLNEFLWFNKFFPWYGAILFPLSALLVANRIYRIEGAEIPFRYDLLIYLLATFASHQLLVDSRFMLDNAIIGYSFIFFTIYFLISKRNLTNRLLGAVFSIFAFLYYYTAGLVLLIVFIFTLVVQIILKKKEEILSINYVTFFVASFIAYYIYLAHAVFHSYILTLREAILSPGAMPAQAVFGRKLFEMTLPHLSAYLNIFLIGSFLIMFIYRWLRGEIKQNYANFITYLCLSLVVISFIFFLWRGLKGLTRLSAYAVLPFLLAFPSLLIRKHKKIGTIFSVLIVVTSLIAYLPGTVTHTEYLTNSEVGAIVWYFNHDGGKELVFTDSRIGTAPVMLNCFTFTGISGEMKRYGGEEEDLEDIYYSENVSRSVVLLAKYGASYLLLSKEMEDFGIFTLVDTYEPLPQAILMKYENSYYFGKIYDNGGAYYFMIVQYDL
jgi:hypothetical protein